MLLIDFIFRLLAGLVAIYIVYKDQQQEIIAIVCLVIAVIGVKQINGIILVLKEKILRAKKWDIPGLGTYEEREPSAAVEPEDLKKLEIDKLKKSFYRLVAAGKNYIQGNYIEQAIECFEDALKIKPRDIELHIMLGYIYGEMIKDKQKAINHCEKALEIDPNSITAQFNLAVYTNHLKGYKSSLPLYEKAEKLIQEQNLTESEIYGKLNLFLGYDLRDSRRKEEAEKCYNKSISILKKLAEKGDQSSAFWLKDAEKNLKELVEQK